MSLNRDELIDLLLTPDTTTSLSVNKFLSILQNNTTYYVLNNLIYPLLPYILDRIYIDSTIYGNCWLKSIDLTTLNQLISTNSILFKLIFNNSEYDNIAPCYTVNISILPLHIQKLIKNKQYKFYIDRYKVNTNNIQPTTIHITQTLSQLNVNTNTTQQSNHVSKLKSTTSYISSTATSLPLSNNDLLELSIQEYYILRFILFAYSNISVSAVTTNIVQTVSKLHSSYTTYGKHLFNPSNIIHNIQNNNNNDTYVIEQHTLQAYKIILKQYLEYILPHRIQHSNLSSIDNTTTTNIINQASNTIKNTLLHNSSFNIQYSNQQQQQQHKQHYNESIQLAISFLTYISDIWLSQNEYKYNTTTQTQQTITLTSNQLIIPSYSLLQCIRIVIQYILIDIYDEYNTELITKQHSQQQYNISVAQLGQDIISTSLYKLLHICYTMYNIHIDNRLLELINIHSEYIQPWLAAERYNNNISPVNDKLQSNITSNNNNQSTLNRLSYTVLHTVEKLEYNVTQQLSSKTDTHKVVKQYTNQYQNYIVHNYMYYSILLYDLYNMIINRLYSVDDNIEQRTYQLNILYNLLQTYNITLITQLQTIEYILLKQNRKYASLLQDNKTQINITQQYILHVQHITTLLNNICQINIEQYEPIFNTLQQSQTRQKTCKLLAIDVLNILRCYNNNTNQQQQIIYNNIETIVCRIHNIEDNIPLTELGKQIQQKLQQQQQSYNIQQQQQQKSSHINHNKPVIDINKLLEPDTSYNTINHIQYITEQGKQQLINGYKLCTRYDIPLLNNNNNNYILPVKSNEFSYIVELCYILSDYICNKTGFKLNLRILANQYIFIFITLLTILPLTTSFNIIYIIITILIILFVNMLINIIR